MASNFSFLGKYWPELALLGETAESYLYSDPNACIFKIGMLAEQIVQGIFSYEKIELPEDTRQSNLIRVLKYRSIIPENIDNILYSIRRARNDAVHVGCESTDRARILLEMAYNLCIWYMEVYGDWSFVAAEYVEPADISSKKEFTSIIESHEEKLKELLEEINRMKTDASEKSAEERKEKAETVSNALEVSNDVQGYIQKESVRMDIEIMPFLNFALQKNKVNIVQSLIIQNDTDENLEDIDLKVKSVPEICLPYEKHIEIVPAKTTVEIKDIKLIANVIYLGNLTEKEEAYITFSLNQGEREICVDNQPISALAFDEWHGSVFYPELLTAFVTPNAPRAIGHPCNHPLSVIGLREYSQSIKERLERCINTYLEALKGMQFAVLKFAGENSLKNPETYESLNSMVERCVQYEIWYQYPAEWALQDKHSVFEDIEAMAQHFATVIDTKEKLLTTLEVLVGNNRDNVTKQESGKVFWPAGINPDNYYGFRASGENENKRDAKDVPVYEALNAMSYILFNDISVEEEDLIREAAKLMGYARVGTGVSTLFKTALKLGCKNGRLIKEDIRWKLTEEGNIFAKNLGSNVVCEEIVSEELNDELDDIDTTTSKLVAKNIKAKEIAKKCALDKITNCDSNCKFYFTCSHAGD